MLRRCGLQDLQGIAVALNQRQRELAATAALGLERSLAAADAGLPWDFWTIDLRDAARRLGAITGALSYFDQLSALICVLALEMAARCRPWLLKRPRDQRLGLQLLDMARIGLLYGLMLDGFKLQ